VNRIDALRFVSRIWFWSVGLGLGLPDWMNVRIVRGRISG
jgi:hypothetical protein